MSKSPPPRRPSRPASAPPRERETTPSRPVRWLRSLLTRRVRLERRGFNVHVVLEKPVLDDTTAPDGSAGDALRRAHAELGALLDRHPDTRHLLRHLGYVERSIRHHGSRAFRQVPVPVLERALEQLELLVRGEQAPAIAPLRARIERALRERGQARKDAGPVTQSVLVSDATQSLFDEMEKSWTGRVPLDPPATGERR